MSDNVLENILFLVKKYNITEKQLLKQCGINTSFLTDWKNGRIKNPSYDKLVKIAQYLNVSLDYLTSRTNGSTPNQDSQNNKGESISNLIKDINNLSDDNKKELEKYLELLKLKDIQDKKKTKCH